MAQSNEPKYPIGGFAPGKYECRCSTCERSFFGDKQAVQCEPCALEAKARFDALSPEEQEALIKKNASIAHFMFSGPLTPERDLIYRIVEQWGNAVEMPNMEHWLKDYAAKRQPDAGHRSQILQEYKQYKENLKYLGGADEWTVEKVSKLNKVEILETIKGFNKMISFLDLTCYAYEEGAKDWEERCLKAESPAAGISQDAHEKEVMMRAFDNVRQIFERRSWIMEGRGSYPYNDDRYKEEVRYMYDEFDKVFKETWGNIKSKSADYKKAIIAEYLESRAAEQPVADKSVSRETIEDILLSTGKHNQEQCSVIADIILRDLSITGGYQKKDEQAAREEDAVEFVERALREGWATSHDRKGWMKHSDETPYILTTAQLYELFKQQKH